jgi:hypothetical protein
MTFVAKAMNVIVCNKAMKHLQTKLALQSFVAEGEVR